MRWRNMKTEKTFEKMTNLLTGFTDSTSHTVMHSYRQSSFSPSSCLTFEAFWIIPSYIFDPTSRAPPRRHLHGSTWRRRSGSRRRQIETYSIWIKCILWKSILQLTYPYFRWHWSSTLFWHWTTNRSLSWMWSTSSLCVVCSSVSRDDGIFIEWAVPGIINVKFKDGRRRFFWAFVVFIENSSFRCNIHSSLGFGI